MSTRKPVTQHPESTDDYIPSDPVQSNDNDTDTQPSPFTIEDINSIDLSDARLNEFVRNMLPYCWFDQVLVLYNRDFQCQALLLLKKINAASECNELIDRSDRESINSKHDVKLCKITCDSVCDQPGSKKYISRQQAYDRFIANYTFVCRRCPMRTFKTESGGDIPTKDIAALLRLTPIQPVTPKEIMSISD